MTRDISDWRKQIQQGRFGAVLDWLKENIHRHGKVYSAQELCTRISGEALNPRYLLDHLERKFGEIYGF
jgi:carboxypeptidase Taq